MTDSLSYEVHSTFSILFIHQGAHFENYWRWAIYMENALKILFIDGETILADVVLSRPNEILFWEAAHLSVEHGITNVKELSSFIIKWYDNEKKEWLSFLLLAGNHYYNMLWKLNMHSNTASSNHFSLMKSSKVFNPHCVSLFYLQRQHCSREPVNKRACFYKKLGGWNFITRIL